MAQGMPGAGQPLEQTDADREEMRIWAGMHAHEVAARQFEQPKGKWEAYVAS